LRCKILPRSEHSSDDQPVQPLRWRPAGRVQPIGVTLLEGSSPSSDDPSLQRRLEEFERNRHAELAQARQAGIQEGLRQAREEAVRELQALGERIAQTLAELATLKRRIRREAESEVVKLALAVARRILRRELATDPEAICGVVHAALEKLQTRELHRVRVFPAGADAVRASLERMGVSQAIQIIADPSLRPGDVLFETSRGELDASIETQLQEIDRGFADRLALR
jgi:flagellar assembly protein FliH